jgi:acyl-CoA thioester hydrolase
LSDNADSPFPAPFSAYEATVQSDWIDTNGHMNLAYFILIFDRGTAALFNALGIEKSYQDTKRCGVFAAETHTLYDREVLFGERVHVVSQVVGADAKRLHIVHEMFHLQHGYRVAMEEIMFLHVDLNTRRVVPFLSEARSAIDAALTAHAGLRRPQGIGRRVIGLSAA